MSWILCLALLALMAGVPAVAADPYEAGVSAFRQGHYDKALDLFLQARRQGRDSAALRYNLAVTYYRLERYAPARELFLGLLGEQPVLAPYNLGLIARAQGDPDRARRYFDQAYRSADPGSRLQALAGRALERVGGLAPSANPLSGGVRVAAGYDDNVAFEPADSRLGREDAFLEGYAWVRYKQRVSPSERISLRTGAYALGHMDYGRYDLTDLTASASYLRRLSTRWEASVELQGGRLWQQGGRALDSAQILTQAERRFGDDWQLRFDFAATRFRAAERYDYLDGVRQEAGLALGYQAEPGWGRLRYAYRRDSRRDYSDTGRFLSYSPSSHRVTLSAGRALGGRWSVSGELEWRQLRYADPDVFSEDGATVRRRREDRYAGAALELSRHIGAHWRAFAELRHSDNGSNIDSNDYRRNVILAGVAWRR